MLNWRLTRLTRYKRVAELLCEKIDANNNITGNIRELTEDELFALNFFNPAVKIYGGDYNAMGATTRLVIKTEAEKLFLEQKSQLLAIQKALVEDPLTQ